MESETCELCFAFRAGTCRYNPPRGIDDDPPQRLWPPVAGDDWCAKWEAAGDVDPFEGVEGLGEEWLEGATAGLGVPWDKGPKPPNMDPGWLRVVRYHPAAGAAVFEVWSHGEELWGVREVDGAPIGVLLSEPEF